MTTTGSRSAAQADEESLEHTRMTLGEHLDELRKRLFRSVVALVLIFCVAWVFHERIAEWLLYPYSFARVRLEEFLLTHFREKLAADPLLEWSEYFERADPVSPADLRDNWRIPKMPRGDGAGSGFIFYMRYCFYFSLFIAGPYALWQAWLFIAAGLYKHERRLVYRSLPISLVLFLAGVLFGFFLLVPYGLYYLAKISVEQIQYWETIDTYSTFLTSLTLATGLVFQLPVVMVVLSRVGLVPASFYSKYRPHMIVLVMIIAAVLTPPDVITQLLMAGPMVVLYEIGALLARISEKKRAQATELKSS